MNEQQLNVFRRLLLAFIAFFSVLFDRAFALEVSRLRERKKAGQLPAQPGGGGAGEASPGTAGAGQALPPAAPEPPPRSNGEALHLLAILQRDGRLVDFLSEDLTGFSDAEIGAAARTVHQGCRKALDSYVDLEPVYREPEGARITVPPGFDPASVRLTGNVVGQPPFQGSLRHHGWRAVKVNLPQASPERASPIIAPAEVEL